MLILARSVGETIVVDHKIKITVLGINGRQVKLGISAPDSISVDRSEIHERKQRIQSE